MAEPVLVKPSPLNAESAPVALEADLTPTSAFYVRTNFGVPEIPADSFRLDLEGSFERGVSLTLDDLKAMPSITLATVMECAGNNRLQMTPLPGGELWHAGALGAASWIGVRLRDVLERGGMRPSAVEILFEGADRGRPADGQDVIPFARSLPLEAALASDVLLAYAMNGEPLSPEHGAPLRLVVPRWYGMASVKWVRRIEALTQPFTGYYQKERYIYVEDDGGRISPVTTMRVKSIVTSPREGETISRGRRVVLGKAWSGEGEIVKVEVAIDGGPVWREAELLPSQGRYAWRAWKLEWLADAPGRHALRSRATDSAGHTQPETPPWNRLGYGNNAVRPVIVSVG